MRIFHEEHLIRLHAARSIPSEFLTPRSVSGSFRIPDDSLFTPVRLYNLLAGIGLEAFPIPVEASTLNSSQSSVPLFWAQGSENRRIPGVLVWVLKRSGRRIDYCFFSSEFQVQFGKQVLLCEETRRTAERMYAA